MLPLWNFYFYVYYYYHDCIGPNISQVYLSKVIQPYNILVEEATLREQLNHFLANHLCIILIPFSNLSFVLYVSGRFF